MKVIKPEDVPHMLLEWFQEYVWTVGSAYQIVVLASAFLLGSLAHRVFKKRIDGTIDGLRLPLRIKRTLRNLEKLCTPIISMMIVFLSLHIAGSKTLNLDIGLLDFYVKLIFAWIVIRVAVEVIGNKLARSIFAVSIWTIAALSIFGVLPQTMETLDAIGMNIGTFRFSALNIIKGVFGLFALLYLAIFASSFFERQILRTKSLTRSSQVLIAKIIRVFLIVLAIIFALTAAGIDLSIFTVLSGAIGLGIGFGLQKVVSNLFSGMLLLMDKSIQPGDVIELEGSNTFGWVNHMGARYTEIITRDNKSYLIPNEEFVTQNVVNWSHGNDRLVRISVEFGVSYNADVHKVIALAKEAAMKPERVVEKPESVCWMTEFGDSSVNFVLRFWIKDAESGVSNIKGEVMLALWDTLKENNIEIPFPQRVVHMVGE